MQNTPKFITWGQSKVTVVPPSPVVPCYRWWNCCSVYNAPGKNQPHLVVLTDVPEIYIVFSSVYLLWHWADRVCSGAWFEMIISSLKKYYHFCSFFLLSLVSVLCGVGIWPLPVLPQGTGDNTQRQVRLAVVLVRRQGSMWCYEELSQVQELKVPTGWWKFIWGLFVSTTRRLEGHLDTISSYDTACGLRWIASQIRKKWKWTVKRC